MSASGKFAKLPHFLQFVPTHFRTPSIKITCGFVLLGATAMAAPPQAIPLNIASGFNDDVIANGSGTAGSSTTIAIDTAADGSVFYDSTYASSHGISSSGALNAGTLSTGVGSFLIAPVSGDNALDFQGSGSGTLSFSSPTSAARLYVLGTAGNGPTTVNYTLNFAGGTTVNGSLTYLDWYNTSQSGTVNGLSHVDRNDGTYDSAQANDFSLYSELISIPEADWSLSLNSISFTYASGGEAAIFAVSEVPEPSTLALAGLGGLSVLLFRRRKS
jgi:hypothetical protein